MLWVRAVALRASECDSRGVGRPTNYRFEYADIAAGLCRLGYTDAMIAQALRVGAATLCDWKRRYPEFTLALRRGRGLPPSPPEPPAAREFPKPENLAKPHIAPAQQGTPHLQEFTYRPRRGRPTTARMYP